MSIVSFPLVMVRTFPNLWMLTGCDSNGEEAKMFKKVLTEKWRDSRTFLVKPERKNSIGHSIIKGGYISDIYSAFSHYQIYFYQILSIFSFSYITLRGELSRKKIRNTKLSKVSVVWLETDKRCTKIISQLIPESDWRQDHQFLTTEELLKFILKWRIL